MITVLQYSESMLGYICMMRFLDKDLLILSDTDEGGEEPEDASAPLFYQPGKRGFYSPRQSRPGLERLNAFRNVGRLVWCFI